MRDIRYAVVTGPTGAVGTALCRCLTRHCAIVYALVRPGSGRTAHLRDIAGIELIECDASEFTSLPRSTVDLHADAFFHLAWAKTVGAGRNDMPAKIQNIQYTIDGV